MRPLQIALCIAVLTSAVVSQTSPGDMVVNVPFAFVASGQRLPAGHYIVKAVDDGRIRIFNSQNVGLYLSTHAARRSKPEGTKLVFHRYGEEYFLSSLWINGNQTGRELFHSKAEMELARRNTSVQVAEVHPER